MLAYGVVQLGTGFVSALSLAVIALGLFSANQGSKVFNQCVEEVRNSGKSISGAVSFCNGGN